MRRVRGLDGKLCAGALMVAWALGACVPPAADPEFGAGGPIVLVSIDTLRSDRLSVYGYQDGETPAIESLRRDGILVMNAYSPVPLTLPAHASLMTGVLPPQHGVRHNLGFRLEADGWPTLAEQLRDLGYATGAAVSCFVLGRASGLDRGFDFYSDEVEGSEAVNLGDLQRGGDASLAQLLDWMEGVDSERFFLFLHLFEPHTPHEAPPALAARLPSPYDAEIAAADRVVGRLVTSLKERGVYESATILLVSDHGEGLDDHGELEHGILLYRESLQVPMILKLPEARMAGATIESPALLTDVLPTLLELAGTTPRIPVEGHSVLSIPDQAAEPRWLYGETYYPQLAFGWSPLTSIILDGYHLIYGPDPELYDLRRDPGERTDLIRERREMSARLRSILRGVDQGEVVPFGTDDATQKAMRSLGYLGGSGVASVGSQIDPKAALKTIEPLFEGMAAAEEEDWPAAVAALQKAVEMNPRTQGAWQILGLALTHLGRPEEAFDAFQRAFELSGGSSRLALPLAALAFESGRYEEALSLARAGLRGYSVPPGLGLLEIRALDRLGRVNEALEAAERRLMEAPDDLDILFQRGSLRHRTRQYEGAEEDLRAVLDRSPDHVEAMHELALLLLSGGDLQGAREIYQRLLTVSPRDPVALANLEALP